MSDDLCLCVCVCVPREFDVEGVTDTRRSLTQLEVKGQRAEPVWSTQLSPDSACSEGSAGSLEQQQDAGERAETFDDDNDDDIIDDGDIDDDHVV